MFRVRLDLKEAKDQQELPDHRYFDCFTNMVAKIVLLCCELFQGSPGNRGPPGPAGEIGPQVLNLLDQFHRSDLVIYQFVFRVDLALWVRLALLERKETMYKITS